MSLTPSDFERISKALSQTQTMMQSSLNEECKGLQCLIEAEEELKQAFTYCLSQNPPSMRYPL
ncbi:hypothetical protein GCM10008967_42980 [Bacillus carboniphilus]|uniref:Uncharacterized protein n=1 Tax=Bacillus carboniphilus TaxID=86663 RepID=A0ABN0WVT6_9BACI